MYSHRLLLLPPKTPSASSSPFRRFLSSSSNSPFESADDFERRLLGSTDVGAGANSFYRKLDRIERAHNNRSGRPYDASNAADDGDLGGYDTLTDGMDDKLKRAATTGFVDGSDESLDGDYMFRPDVTFIPGSDYSPEDLDLTKPGIQRGSQTTKEFQTTTKEVLKKADFRNVRFLSNFLTEAGIIIKRSQTKISAKAQRKVAREIKTARAFGLMPFTCMGTKPFIFGNSMQDHGEESGI
ncbi:uncharacterized protein M6B38_145205 [Iris pallida]|uniref:Small ribosomal subunit protein bS18c n=2 Tax=Iris pallida TaxID=29817 RepID=A0AAX6FAU5_IRIPA|nr:uncharacterized protein M6B38_145205 [Iris pallida]